MAKMSESHPPGEEDTSYFADSLEQDGKCALVFSSVWEWLIIREVNFTLDPNLLDYPSVESQF